MENKIDNKVKFDKKQQREKRLAKQLRENLLKRKAQARCATNSKISPKD